MSSRFAERESQPELCHAEENCWSLFPLAKNAAWAESVASALGASPHSSVQEEAKEQLNGRAMSLTSSR